MKLYASVTGTKRNLEAMKAGGFGLLVTSGSGHRPVEGFSHAIDNGKFRCWKEGSPWCEQTFRRTVAAHGGGADWIVAPDIVAGGLASLNLTVSWLPELRRSGAMILIAVQDGMEPSDVAGLVEPGVIGIFMGGSTEWKLANIEKWGRWCAAREGYFHVGRVNTARRIYLAIAAGAQSVDGTSASRFAKTVPLLCGAARQRDLLSPTRAA